MAALPDPDPSSPAWLGELADRCVQCGLCLPHCPTYRLDASESESPRGRINYMKAVATGRLDPSETGDRHLDHCLGCRRCESACPAGVEYERLLTGARAAQRRRSPLPAGTRLSLALLARPRLLDALAQWQSRLPEALRPLPVAPPASAFPHRAAGPASETEAAIFVGCIASPYESPTRAALAGLLATAGVRATIPDGQGCCGMAATHAGDAAQATGLAATNHRAFAGHAQVLTLASGCHPAIAAALPPASQATDALVFLAARADRLAFRSAGGARVALHLPCSQRFAGTQGATLSLLAKVPGLEVAMLPDTGCCGAAGLHMRQEPARAAALRQPLLDALPGLHVGAILSANIGCRLHLAGGTALPVRHPIDFLAEHLA